jgi:hypothetical protein
MSGCVKVFIPAGKVFLHIVDQLLLCFVSGVVVAVDGRVVRECSH